MRSGSKHTEETKAKLRKAHLGVPRPDLSGENSVMRRPDIAAKSGAGRRGEKHYMHKPGWNPENHPMKRPEVALKSGAGHAGEKCNFWKGGVSFEPYCPKFNSKFKKRVRAFFKGTCVMCGCNQKETKRSLDVHHVNFDKMTCCNSTLPLFAALCNPCHRWVTAHREEAEEMLTGLVNTVYGGKSYLTEEEYVSMMQLDHDERRRDSENSHER